MQAQDLINEAAMLLQAITPGQTLNPEEYAQALATLNEVIDQWNTQHLFVFTIENNQYALTTGTGAYTFGTGGSLASVRPVKIESAGIIRALERQPLKLIGPVEWDLIPEKTAQALLPTRLYYDSAYPLATVNLWPVPAAWAASESSDPYLTTPQLDISTWQAIASFPLLSSTFAMPPGYQRALAYTLAVAMAEQLRVQAPPNVMSIAASSAAAIQKLNLSNQIAVEDVDIPAPKGPPGPSAQEAA